MSSCQCHSGTGHSESGHGGHKPCLSFPPTAVGWIWQHATFTPGKGCTHKSPLLGGNGVGRELVGMGLCTVPPPHAWSSRDEGTPVCPSCTALYSLPPPSSPQIPMGNHAQEPQPLLTPTLWGFGVLGEGGGLRRTHGVVTPGGPMCFVPAPPQRLSPEVGVPMG